MCRVVDGEERVERIALVQRHAEVFRARLRVVRHLRHLVLVVGQVESEVHAPIATLVRPEDFSLQLKFDARVRHLSVVDGQRRPSRRRVKVGTGQQVAAFLPVDVQRTAQAVVHHGEVQARVPRGGLFPTKLVVGRRQERAGQCAVVAVGAEARRQVGRHAGVDVSRQAEAGTQLQDIYPVDGLQERLVVGIPTGTHRPERASAELRVGAEQVGLVHAV